MSFAMRSINWDSVNYEELNELGWDMALNIKNTRGRNLNVKNLEKTVLKIAPIFRTDKLNNEELKYVKEQITFHFENNFGEI